MLQTKFFDLLSLNILESISEYKDIFSNIFENNNILGVFIISFVLFSVFFNDVKWIVHYSSKAAKDLLGKILVGAITGGVVGTSNAVTTKLLNRDNNNNNNANPNANNNNNNNNTNPNANNNNNNNTGNTNSNDGNTQNKQ